jgi:hypothetical protein
MKTLLRTLAPLVFVLAVLGAPRSAHALGPIGLEVGAIAGYGASPDSSSPVNTLGIGLGGRAGVVLFDHLYGGVKLIDYLGGSTNVATVPVSYHALQYGLDVGYGFSIPLLTIRPQVGVGNVALSDSAPGVGNVTAGALYIEPGVTALLGLGLLFVGADANYMILPAASQPDGSSKTEGAVTIHAQVGVKL